MTEFTVYCKECDWTTTALHTEEPITCPKCKTKANAMELRKMRYRHLNEKQRKELCNGCGGKGGFVKPPYAELFERCCQHHDFNYFLGYRHRDRFRADFQLFIGLLEEIWLGNIFDEADWKFPVRCYLSLWTILYYIGITLFGWKFFYYGEKEQEIPEL